MEKIVIIDDEPYVVNTLHKFLVKHGYNIFSSTDVYEGLTLIRNFLPDLIIMDLRMPKMDGFEAIEKIRKDERLKQIPVIVLTGLGDYDSLMKLKELAITGFIKKPYYPDELLERVQSVLGENQPEQEEKN